MSEPQQSSQAVGHGQPVELPPVAVDCHVEIAVIDFNLVPVEQVPGGIWESGVMQLGVFFSAKCGGCLKFGRN